MSIEEKYDEVKELILMGKERGYLLYDEVNDLLPEGICSSDELDSIFSLFGSAGIEVIDSEQKLDGAKKPGKKASLILARSPWTRPTIPCACISARWGRSRC